MGSGWQWDIDVVKAFAYMIAPALGPRPHSGRVDVLNYSAFGCVSYESAVQAASLTMEYAFDDWASAQVARMLNRSQEHARFLNQSSFYANVWSAASQLMCPKFRNGSLACPDAIEALAFYPIGSQTYVDLYIYVCDIGSFVKK